MAPVGAHQPGRVNRTITKGALCPSTIHNLHGKVFWFTHRMYSSRFELEGKARRFQVYEMNRRTHPNADSPQQPCPPFGWLATPPHPHQVMCAGRTLAPPLNSRGTAVPLDLHFQSLRRVCWFHLLWNKKEVQFRGDAPNFRAVPLRLQHSLRR